MITGELKSQIDKIWNDFWTGGISNPLTVIEQFTYLIFLKQLDDKQILIEKEIALLGSTTKKPGRKKTPNREAWGFFMFGALDRIRTCDRSVRSRVLYPAELRVQGVFVKPDHPG